jgi:peptidylprolyl isomerase
LISRLQAVKIAGSHGATSWKALVNKFASLALCASALLVLSGCTNDASEEVAAVSELAEGCAPSGEVVESITVAGDFGARPEVNFTAPLEVTATQRAVVIEGDGELVENGDDVVVDYALFNATTGADIEDSGYDEFSPTVLRVDTVAPVFMGVSLTTVCSSVGSRVVGVIPATPATRVRASPPWSTASLVSPPSLFQKAMFPLSSPCPR